MASLFKSAIQQKQLLNLSDQLEYKRDIPVRFLPTIRAGVTVVWLVNNQRSLSNENNARLHTLSRNDRCYIVCYSSLTKCIKHLKRSRSCEYVIVVVISYPTEVIHKIIHRLRPYRIVQTIYVVSTERNAVNCFTSTTNDIVIFQDKETMLDRLEPFIDNIQKENFDGGLFSTFNRKEKALKDIRRELAAFVWSHVFKVVVISMACNSPEAKQQMLAECRAYYRNNAIQLFHINEFERTYQACDAIRWYTKPGFLFYLINKALRSEDNLALYTFRFFIADLCKRLEVVAATHTCTSFRLYRGAKLHRSEVESFEIGSLVATNGFLSCSCDRDIAQMFIGVDPSTGKSPSCGRDESQQFALFEIDVDLINSPDVVIANVSAYSMLPGENEMIFTLGSTFIINHIRYDEQKYLWFIQMSSFSDLTQTDHEYDRYIRIRLQLTNPTILFGRALTTIKSEYSQSLDYFHRLLRTLPINHDDRPIVYYELGRIYFFIEKHQKALTYFRCAELLLRRLLPQRMFDYCRALGGTGSVYSNLGDSKRAINRLEQAITLQRKSLPENQTEIPFHLNRLGHAYFNAKQFERALAVLLSADNFFRTRMPTDHQGHGQTLHTMALVHRALGDNERAYNYFKEALRKRDSLLAKDHPKVAATFYQLSLLHEDRGEYDLALEFAKKSLRIQSIKLPHYHSELKLSNELVNQLQQRQTLLHIM